MPNYRRAFVPGGCWFFTVNLLERRQTLRAGWRGTADYACGSIRPTALEKTARLARQEAPKDAKSDIYPRARKD
jgi:hypothetical protein